MKITYDKIADAMYIYVKKAKVAKSVEINDHTIIDVDSVGGLIGIELLAASKFVPKKLIKSSIQLSGIRKTITI